MSHGQDDLVLGGACDPDGGVGERSYAGWVMWADVEERAVARAPGLDFPPPASVVINDAAGM